MTTSLLVVAVPVFALVVYPTLRMAGRGVLRAEG
jgi:hypothetical protein